MDICARCRTIMDVAAMSLKQIPMFSLVISLLFETIAGAFECKKENKECPRGYFCTEMGNCLPCHQICMNGETYHPSQHCRQECPNFQAPPTVIPTESPAPLMCKNQSAFPGQPRVEIASQREDNISNTNIGLIVLSCALSVVVIGLVIYILVDKLKRTKSTQYDAATVSSNGNTNGTAKFRSNGSASVKTGDASNGEDIAMLKAQDPSAPPPNDEEKDTAENKSPVVTQPEEGVASSRYEVTARDAEVPASQLTKDALSQRPTTTKDLGNDGDSDGVHQQETDADSQAAAAVPKADPATIITYCPDDVLMNNF